MGDSVSIRGAWRVAVHGVAKAGHLLGDWTIAAGIILGLELKEEQTEVSYVDFLLKRG